MIAPRGVVFGAVIAGAMLASAGAGWRVGVVLERARGEAQAQRLERKVWGLGVEFLRRSDEIGGLENDLRERAAALEDLARRDDGGRLCIDADGLRRLEERFGVH